MNFWAVAAAFVGVATAQFNVDLQRWEGGLKVVADYAPGGNLGGRKVAFKGMVSCTGISEWGAAHLGNFVFQMNAYSASVGFVCQYPGKGAVSVPTVDFADDASSSSTTTTTTKAPTTATTAATTTTKAATTTTKAATTTTATTTKQTTTAAPQTTTTTTTTASSGSGSGSEWEARNGHIYHNNVQFDVQGVNWFGFETDVAAPHGLWSVSAASILDVLKAKGFNAIRVPMAVDHVLNNPTVSAGSTAGEPSIGGKKYLDAISWFVTEAGKRGIYAMLDMHRLESSTWPDDGLGFVDSNVIVAWKKVTNALCSNNYVFAADMWNEPHGGEWGTGSSKDFRLAAQTFGNAILDICPRWLIFVEGVGSNDGFNNVDGAFWGENLVGYQKYPAQLKVANRLVYSPHSYGPSVASQTYYSAANFPDNLPGVWDAKFGYLRSSTSVPLVIGEWGGKYTSSQEITYMKKQAAYFKSKGIGQFFWCVNPNSGDTGGLFQDDWKTPVSAKFDLLATLTN